jgi:alanine-glyoxylate transaminase/serine-glyoxylate transaminase/serine-pyruvate transaminase
LDINTPFSVERIPDTKNDIKKYYTTPPSPRRTLHTRNITETKNPDIIRMATSNDHPRLMIPGPVEFDDAVLQSMSHYRYSTHSFPPFAHAHPLTPSFSPSESHVGMAFVNIFSEVLSMLRRVLQTTNPASQPFVISGSGTLGWDMVAANLIERDEEVLVLHTGYFADSFAECFRTYGVRPTQIKAPIGSRPQLDEIEAALRSKPYKMITVTAVDTSTGVLSELRSLSQLVRRVSPDTLVVVDAVCAVGSEEIAFDEWDLDVVLTASQKALGCPAGLCIMMASARAMERYKTRSSPPASYFGSFANWLPSAFPAVSFISLSFHL